MKTKGMKKTTMIVLYESSGTTRRAFRDKFNDATHAVWSADLLPADDGETSYHLQVDAEVLLRAVPDKWFDLIVMHPPCTALTVAGNGTYGTGKSRHQERLDAIAYTEKMWELAKQKGMAVALENPVGVLSTCSNLGKPTQYIQPYQHGHTESKKTGLWLYNLPPLKETHNVYSEMMQLPIKERQRVWYMSPGPERWKERSKTYQGIAAAMADQWGPLI